MGRKKETVYHLKEKNSDERNLVRGLYRVGVVHEEDIRKHFSRISHKRFRGMVNSGFIYKTGKYYVLGDEGKKYCENKLGMRYKFKHRPEHIKHNAKLSKFYLSLNKKQRETWKTETEKRMELSQKKEYHDLYHNPLFKNSRKNFIPDATYYAESLGREVMVEAITKHYSKEDIDMKMKTAECFFSGEVIMF
jgi:hypothetical protein